MTATTLNRRHGSLGRAMVWLVAAYAISLVGYLAVNLMAARLLGASDFGSFLVVITVGFVVGQLALFGAHRAGLRDVSRIDDSDQEALAAIGREATAVMCFAVPAVAAVSAAIYFAAAEAAGSGHALALGLELGALIFVNALQRLGASYLRGLGRLATASFLDGSAGGALTLGVQGALLGVLLLAGSSPDVATVLAVVVLGYAPSTAIILIMLRGIVRPAAPAALLGALRSSLPRYRVFAVIQVVGYAGASLEIWLAALTLSATDASYFGACQRLALMCAVPLTALQSVLSPAISRNTLGRDHQLLQSSLRTSASLAMLAALALAVPVVVWPSASLRLFFGTEVPGFTGVLALLIVAQLANVATGMCGPVLTMTRYEGTVAKATTIALVLRLVVGVLAALLAGALGLAVSSTVIAGISWVYLVAQARAKCSLNTLPSWRPSIVALRRMTG